MCHQIPTGISHADVDLRNPLQIAMKKFRSNHHLQHIHMCWSFHASVELLTPLHSYTICHVRSLAFSYKMVHMVGGLRGACNVSPSLMPLALSLLLLSQALSKYSDMLHTSLLILPLMTELYLHQSLSLLVPLVKQLDVHACMADAVVYAFHTTDTHLMLRACRCAMYPNHAPIIEARGSQLQPNSYMCFIAHAHDILHAHNNHVLHSACA